MNKITLKYSVSTRTDCIPIPLETWGYCVEYSLLSTNTQTVCVLRIGGDRLVRLHDLFIFGGLTTTGRHETMWKNVNILLNENT